MIFGFLLEVLLDCDCCTISMREFLLDAIPLIVDIKSEDEYFAQYIHKELLDLFCTEHDAPSQVLRRKNILELLSLACDLGYLDDLVLAYLIKGIKDL
jgi:hypothetical protein